MRPRTHGSSKIIQNLLKLVVITAAIVLVVFILINKSNSSTFTGTSRTGSTQTSNSSDSTSGAYAILSPATVTPKIAECNQSVSYSSSGVPAPLQCSNGYLNVAAWNALSAQEPKVMALGYSPTQSQVQAAICSDVNAAASDSTAGADDAIESSVFQITSLYYDWNSAKSAGSYIANC